MASRLTKEQAKAITESHLALPTALPTEVDVTAEVDGQIHQWTLRDDVAAGVMMHGMDLDRMQAEVALMIEQGDAEGAVAAQARYDAVLDFIFFSIFRATYPDVNLDLLRRGFNRMERLRLVMRFFGVRLPLPSRVFISGEDTPAEPKPATATTSGKTKTKKLMESLG